MDLSYLQIDWGFKSKFFIIAYVPLCILLGLIGTLRVNSRPVAKRYEDEENKIWNSLFYVILFAFFAQFLWGVPPALSDDPMNNRLTWGMKYLHVLTEIIFRTTLLLCLGTAVNRGRFLKKDLKIIVPFILYAFLMVSRGLVIEIFFYILLASILINSKKNSSRFKLSLKHYLFFSSLWIFFIIYGQWRQGADFSISEYGEMRSVNSTMAWIFGYFLVNFDNLALIIEQNYYNHSLTNVFGPLLQTFQITPYLEVDDYLYVGRFNLGTALRPFVLDYGPWVAGFVFTILWSFWIKVMDFCAFEKSKYTILLLLSYVGFCLPMTGRMEQPPYLVPLLLIVGIDWVGNLRLKIRGEKEKI